MVRCATIIPISPRSGNVGYPNRSNSHVLVTASYSICGQKLFPQFAESDTPGTSCDTECAAVTRYSLSAEYYSLSVITGSRILLTSCHSSCVM